MQGLGSTYLTLQTFGGTVLGGVTVIVGILGAIMAKSTNRKLIWGGIALAGGLIIWGSNKAREHISINKETSDNYGLLLLGLFSLGTVASIFKR